MSLSNRTCFQTNLRDRLKCHVCGRAPHTQLNYHRGFEYHHVQLQSQGGADEAWNLILLCNDCHTKLHQNRLTLPPPGDLTPPEKFYCFNCYAILNTEAVEMNCGWYRCDNCGEKIHLFKHFGYKESN
jgi:hypothetical protein